jgi:diadenosine tetraphosphate (Ap4A) HIT family hydrolase
VSLTSASAALDMAASGPLHRMKMSYEIHGNTIPHLHMHLFPKSAADPYVGYVITSRVSFTRTRAELDAIASAVREELAACGRLL